MPVVFVRVLHKYIFICWNLWCFLRPSCSGGGHSFIPAPVISLPTAAMKTNEITWMMILSGLISKARPGLVIIRIRDLKCKLKTRLPNFYTPSWSRSLQLFCNKSPSCKDFTKLFMFMKDRWKKVVQMAKKKKSQLLSLFRIPATWTAVQSKLHRKFSQQNIFKNILKRY